MKKNFGLILAIVAITLSLGGLVQGRPAGAPPKPTVPTIVSYQGHIYDGETPYHSTGFFKFEIITDIGELMWSNDGNQPPLAAIELKVENGYFSVNLGDTSLDGMDIPLTAEVFERFASPYLVIHFSPDDHDWTKMPPQPIASVPYALRAEAATSAENATNAQNAVNATNATYADLLDGQHASAFQLRVTGICPSGTAVQIINQDGTVVCESVTNISRYTLKTVDDSGNTGRETSIAIGIDGLPLITYRDSNYDLFVAHCNDIYCADATISILVSDVVVWTPNIAIGSDGFGIITYHDFTNGDLKVVHCTNADCTTFGLATLDTNDDVGYFNSIAIGADGLPLIVYYDETNKDLRTIHCSNAACSSISGFGLIDSVGDVGKTNSLVIGSDDLGLISYYDETNTSLKVFHCTNQNCTSGFAYTIDNSANVGGYSSIAIGTDGLGLISYYDVDNQDLKVAHCNNTECSTATTYTLDSNGQVGGYSSLVIGTDGLGIISYYDQTNGYLKSAHCDGLICKTATISVLDGWGSVGRDTSIAIGVDGMPVISYYDVTNTNLKVAHCSNELCLPINWEH